jgi:MraZ protein
MYYGSHPTVIDDKGRITAPRRFHELMERHDHITWFITRGYKGCLYLYNLKEWESLVSRVELLDPLDPKAHDFLRLVYGCALDVKVDRQGRIPIPAPLRSFAALDSGAASEKPPLPNREVVLVGMRNHLELWRKDAWDAYQANMGAEYENMASELLIRPRHADMAEDKGLQPLASG